MNIVIPMAGAGSRFTASSLPKPFIPVNGKTMIEAVINSLDVDGHYILIVMAEHINRFGRIFNVIANGVKQLTTIPVETRTEGQACSCLLAETHIDNYESLLIANCDQIISDLTETSLDDDADTNCLDGIIMTFPSTSPTHSYARVEHDLVVETAEKKVISDQATCGIYYWRHGYDFVASARTMIDHDDRTNGEFYVCPSFNYLIRSGKRIGIKQVRNFQPIGTPAELSSFLGQGTT